MLRRRLLPLLATLPLAASAAPQAWHFDPVHTQIVFAVDHLGFAHALGLVTLHTSAVQFDADDWTQSTIRTEVDLTTLAMGDVKWQDTVKSWQFLRTKRWPLATFTSTAIERTGERTGVAHGTLELHGTRQPLDIVFTLNKRGRDAYSMKDTAGFSATAQLKRSAYGMDKLLSAVGDVVDLRIEAELQRGAAKAPGAAPAATESKDEEKDDGTAQ